MSNLAEDAVNQAYSRKQRLLREQEALLRAQYRAKARKSLIAFSRYTMPSYHLNWHHVVTARLMEYAFYKRTVREFLASIGIAGKTLARMMKHKHEVTGLYAGMTHPNMIDSVLNNIQIMFSPRCGKTELASRRYPAWWLGRDPNGQIIATSFGKDLAQQNNRDIQRIIDDEQYDQLFPGTKLFGSNVRTVAKGSYLRNSDIFEVVGHKGFYKASGVGGQIMGRGASLATVDDPFKSRKQAESPVERLTIEEWFNSTLYSRLEPGAVRMIMNTRWHQRDLSGVTIEAAQADFEAEQWFCLVFPALLDCEPGPGDPRKQGESIWPWKYPVERLKRIKKTSAYDFEALHQQRPTVREGAIIKSSWWKFYDEPPADISRQTISVDLTFGNRGDYCAFQLWGEKNAQRFLLDQIHGRYEFVEQVQIFARFCAKYPKARIKLVEQAANGEALISTLGKHIQGIKPIKVTSGSKALRLEACAPQIEAGNVILPNPTRHRWVNEFILEFSAFPSGAHDDQIDACTQYLNWAQQHERTWRRLRPVSVTKDGQRTFDNEFGP